MRELLRRLAGSALLLESRCPGCGAVLRQGACARCGQAQGGEGQEGPWQDEEERPWGLLLAAGAYEGELRELILAYKFEARLDLGRRLQELLLAAFDQGVLEHPELAGCQGLVPVPLHPRRLLARGFNQSREMARLLSARRGLPLRQEALARVRRTVPQMELRREERALNIRGAFRAREQEVRGLSLLLVDDIMTTGSTLEECARALLAAGAARVDVLVLARA